RTRVGPSCFEPPHANASSLTLVQHEVAARSPASALHCSCIDAKTSSESLPLGVLPRTVEVAPRLTPRMYARAYRRRLPLDASRFFCIDFGYDRRNTSGVGRGCGGGAAMK